MHDRHDLTDEQFALLEPFLPDRSPQRGGRWADHRQMIDGVLWRTRAGAPWRDLPSAYGPWQTVYERHRRWSGDGTWARILDGLRIGADAATVSGPGPGQDREWIVSVDSTVVRAHQDAAGARRVVPKDVSAQQLAGVLDVLAEALTGG